MDSSPSAGTLSSRQRRALIKAVVRENVYIKAGKRPPLGRSRPWLRWLVAGLAIPGVAAGAWFWLPEAQRLYPPELVPPPATAVRPLSAASGWTGSQARRPARPAAADLAGRAALSASLGEPRPIDRAVFPVGVRRIVLDPGHGGKDTGSVTPDGQLEKEITLDIAQRLGALLTDEGVDVLLTRADDREVPLKERTRFANEAQADLFVSIHLNWLVPATNRGVETFYLGPTDDPFLVQLTSRENRVSGYSLADVRKLLDGIYLDLRQRESRQLAAAVQQSLFRALKQETPSLRDRGVKSAPFLVLVTTEMPAILAEVSCLSNEGEAALLATAEYRQGIAEALRAGIEAYTMGLSKVAQTGSPNNES